MASEPSSLGPGCLNPLGDGVTLVQGTAQLLSAGTTSNPAVLRVWTPNPGEVVVQLPHHATETLIDGKPAPVQVINGGLALSVPSGVSTLTLQW